MRSQRLLLRFESLPLDYSIFVAMRQFLAAFFLINAALFELGQPNQHAHSGM